MSKLKEYLKFILLGIVLFAVLFLLMSILPLSKFGLILIIMFIICSAASLIEAFEGLINEYPKFHKEFLYPFTGWCTILLFTIIFLA